MEKYKNQLINITIPPNVEVTEPLRIYLEEIGQIPVLSAQEEQELGRKLAVGDESAKQSLEEASLRLVVSIAGNYTDQGLLFMDLIQEGNIGLMHAMNQFEYTEGRRFSEFAALYIEEAIQTALDEQSEEIGIPAQVAEDLQKVKGAARVLQEELGREATVSEIAEQVGDRTEEEVEAMLVLLTDPTVLEDGEFNVEEGDTEGDGENTSEKAMAALIIKEEVQQLLDGLDEQERQVISLRFGLTDKKVHTPEDVGLLLGISENEAQKIEELAMLKLKAAALKE